MTKREAFFFASVLVLSIVACAPKPSDVVGDIPISPVQPKEDFGDKVQGPNLEGTWDSKCIYDKNESKFRQKKIVFGGKSVARSNVLYSDNKCTQVTEKLESQGVYRWLNTTSYGGYHVEYKFEENGGHVYTQEELLVENKTLYLSDFSVGFGVISKEIPMDKVD